MWVDGQPRHDYPMSDIDLREGTGGPGRRTRPLG